MINAHYVRFETYIPQQFFAKDDQGKRKLFTTDPILIEEFLGEIVERYGGATQANPFGASPYKGLWKGSADSPIAFDYLTYVFGLVRQDQADDATGFFNKWKGRLEEKFNQEIILVVYFPVQVLGGFL